MKIAMIASEANPLIKTGGLADVVYSLSLELNKLDNKAVIILPYYKKIKNNPQYSVTFLGKFDIFMSWRKEYCGVFKLVLGNIEYYLIDNEQYFLRDNPYGYGDDGERFAFFSLAALQALKLVDFKPDVVHIHDWQVGMIPCLLKEKYRNDPFFSGVKSVLTIHNPEFKGYLDKYFLNNYYGLSDTLFDNGKVRFDGMVSTLKSGITFSDIITTVSPTHRDELLDPLSRFKFSYVLELRKDDFYGIVNGVDTVEFNPKEDKYLCMTYDVSKYLRSRTNNKKDLINSFHLPNVISKNPIFGVVTRLTEQKGIDLILENIPYLVEQGGSIVILGSGDPSLEDKVQKTRDRYSHRVGIYIGYNDELAHKIYGGCDFFLMPSLFEPCGISQIIAQRYGAVPIVRETGGLKDTVIGYKDTNLAVANGLSFQDYTVEGLRGTIEYAFRVYADDEKMKTIVKNGMKLDRSWKTSALEYMKIYRKALEK